MIVCWFNCWWSKPCSILFCSLRHHFLQFALDLFARGRTHRLLASSSLTPFTRDTSWRSHSICFQIFGKSTSTNSTTCSNKRAMVPEFRKTFQKGNPNKLYSVQSGTGEINWEGLSTRVGTIHAFGIHFWSAQSSSICLQSLIINLRFPRWIAFWIFSPTERAQTSLSVALAASATRISSSRKVLSELLGKKAAFWSWS